MRLRPGGIIDSDTPGGIEMIEYPPAIADAFTEVEASDTRSQRISGANEIVTQGGMQGPSSITRTATGMNALSAGVGARLGYFIDFISDLIFVPALEFFQESNSKWLDEETISSILTEKLETAYDGDMLDVVNAKLKFKMLASAKARARQALAQNLMPMMQVFQQQPVQESLQLQGKTFDWAEFAQAVADISEISGSQKWVRALSEEEKQALKAKNEFAQQTAQGAFENQHALQQIKATGDSQLKTAMAKELTKGLVDQLSAGMEEEKGESDAGKPGGMK